MANQQSETDSEIEQNESQPSNPESEASAEQNNHNEKKEDNNAFLVLRRAVSQEVVNQAKKIAKALIKSTRAGNSNSARIVVFVIDERNDKKLTLNQPKVLDNLNRRSVALDLAAQPPYAGPDEDEEVPDYFGS